jgi:hypothetical protein
MVTLVVAVLPVAIVWGLWAGGILTSAWVAAPLVVVLALLASLGGAAYWKRRPATGDVLFADLLLWGWLRRARAERRMADAVELLRHSGSEDEAEKLRLLGELAEALDAKDPYLDGHSHRVARFSALMTRRLAVPPEEGNRIHTAAAIHDVGKLHVSPTLLAKPSCLSPAEAKAVQRHAEEGAAMVACLGDPSLSNIVRHHHERFDGGGYPAGLSGEAIPLGARIVAVADTFDAITSARPYRPAETPQRQARSSTPSSSARSCASTRAGAAWRSGRCWRCRSRRRVGIRFPPVSSPPASSSAAPSRSPCWSPVARAPRRRRRQRPRQTRPA